MEHTSPDRRISVMGIVNLTDNSYFASSRCMTQNGEVDMHMALDRTARMLEEGADIIDIGACSTRPGSQPVGAGEEWRRLGPFLKQLRRTFGDGIRISVDTYWASVVQRCFDTIGDFIINDISARGRRSGNAADRRPSRTGIRGHAQAWNPGHHADALPVR